MIEIRSEGLARAMNVLNRFPEQMQKSVLTNAANRALAAARTESWRAVKQEYAVSREAFYKNAKTTVRAASSMDLNAVLDINSNLIPLLDFKHSGGISLRGGKGRQLKVEVMRGSENELKYAFLANLGRYGPEILERTTPRRDSSEQKYGPSAAHMVGNTDVLEKMDEVAAKTFENRIDHEIDRIVGGG